MKRVRTAFGLPQTRADFAVILGLFVLEAQVFEFRFDVVKAQTVGQRRIHEQRLRGDFLLLVGTHVLEGAHVVQAVRQLDQNHPHVVAQRQQHLAEVLGLGARPGLEHSAHLGQAIDNGTLLGPKHPLHILQGHVGVLHGVVQEGAHDACRAQAPSPPPPHAPRRWGGRCRAPRFCVGCPCARPARHRRPCEWPCAPSASWNFWPPATAPGTSEESPAFPLPNRIPSPRKFGILPSICTSPSNAHEPSVVHYFRTMTDATMTSWIEVPAGHDFPLANLPFGVFSTADRDARPGMRLGDHVIDLSALHAAGSSMASACPPTSCPRPS